MAPSVAARIRRGFIIRSGAESVFYSTALLHGSFITANFPAGSAPR